MGGQKQELVLQKYFPTAIDVNVAWFLSVVAAHLTGIHSAIKMLNSRIRVLHHYLAAMQKGILTSFLLKFLLIQYK